MSGNERAEIVIVGGGITGACIAASLADRGTTDVILVEKDHLAAGSTGRSAAVFETQYLNAFDVELRARSIERFERLAADTSIELHRIGYMLLLFDPAYEDAYRESIRHQARHGVTDARFLAPDEILDIVPDLNIADVHGAIYGPSNGYADPRRVTRAIADRARERGVEIVTDTAIEDVATAGGGVAAVETPAGRIACEAVVNAAGPWAPRLAARTGLDLPAVPYRRQLLVGHRPDGTASEYTVPMVMGTAPGRDDPGLYFRDDGNGRVVLGIGMARQGTATDEAATDPDDYDEDYDRDFAARVFERIDHRIPAFADLEIDDGWAGLYTVTPDTAPIIDEHPDLSGYYIAAGFSGKGFQIGPIVGDLVTELVLDGEPTSVSTIAPLRLDRFE